MNTNAPLAALKGNQAQTMIQGYIDENNPEKVARERYMEDNASWDDVDDLSIKVLTQLTQAPSAVAAFFNNPDIYMFVPVDERPKVQASITTLTNTITPLLEAWKTQRAKHEGKTGKLTDISEVDPVVFLTSEYFNLSEQFSGLTDDVLNYIYGVMATTEMNISSAKEHIDAQKENAEQTNKEGNVNE